MPAFAFQYISYIYIFGLKRNHCVAFCHRSDKHKARRACAGGQLNTAEEDGGSSREDGPDA